MSARVVVCGNCDRPMREHCEKHAIRCCPGHCTGTKRGYQSFEPTQERDAKSAYVCDRCNVECELQTRPGLPDKWYCPCCRSRTTTVEQMWADVEREAAERSLTVEQVVADRDEEAAKFVARPTVLDMEQARALAERMKTEWKPACEHDTENPFLPIADGREAT